MPVRLLRAVAPLLLALGLALPASVSARVPPDWSGVTLDWGPVLRSAPRLGDELARMRDHGVGQVRVAVYWSVMQPYQTMAEVPAERRADFVAVDGIPTDFRMVDRMMDRASRRGLKLLPVVLDSPPWARRGKRPLAIATPPNRAADFGRFLTTLVRRYGPNGNFWVERPGVPFRPIRTWQVWNEPNLPEYWPKPFERSFVRFTRESRRALKRADPGSQLVLAGLTGVSWEALKKIYRAGGRGTFDIAAFHPYTKEPRNVVRILTRARKIMAEHRDLHPIMATELTWPAAAGRVYRTAPHYGFETNERGAAARLAEAYRLLAENREDLQLKAVFWYAWMTGYRNRRDPFDYAGLRMDRGDGGARDTPLLGVLRRVVSGL